MMGDTLFLSTSYNRVVALDANTGAELWSYDPKAYTAGQPPNGTGFVHRGVATWTDGTPAADLHEQPLEPDRARRGDGRADSRLRRHGRRRSHARSLSRNGKPVNRLHYTQTSPPVVWRDLVIVGNGVADKLIYPNDPPGDVQAFDVKIRQARVELQSQCRASDATRRRRRGTNESWRTTGHTNVWAPMSVDEQRGLIYLPVSTPSNDWYGGARRGDNLFAESIVCLDARNGEASCGTSRPCITACGTTTSQPLPCSAT